MANFVGKWVAEGYDFLQINPRENWASIVARSRWLVDISHAALAAKLAHTARMDHTGNWLQGYEKLLVVVQH
ncbi:hypothetical protein V6N12_045327 [Hibiscus sabdariffa]|uniref:Uncharacterized protein n=1 Tax=Hibiscus sabdariffa TaxID=183260 RepID=A0ABR2G2Y4_9ROSI